jgi:nucleoside-specific outer membrane channel protein Tsx
MTHEFTPSQGLRLAASLLALCAGGLVHAQDAAQDNTHLPPEEKTHAPAKNWNDTFLSYRYSGGYTFPGSSAKVAQNIGSLTTTGGFALGSYYFNVDYLQSDHNNAEASPNVPAAYLHHGAQETYSVGHVEWSGSKIFGTHLGVGLIRDFGLTTGYEWGTKDDEFEQRAKMWMIGLTAEFAVPGYWNLTVGARNEQNFNGITGVDLHYDTAWHVDSAWMIPFNVGPAPLVFKGFVAVTGPKGEDGFGPEKTVTETLLRTSLLLDAGALFGHPRTFYVGPGFEHWNHMFGAPSTTPGTKHDTPVFVAEAHF